MRIILSLFLLWAWPLQALAWGDEGHKVIGIIAEHFLEPIVRQKVDALLAADADTLTGADFVSRTTWADRWRDSDRYGSKARYYATQQWHFVDQEMSGPDLNAACFGHPSLNGKVASDGPAQDCVVDKIEQFAVELKATDTSMPERTLALKFLLHLIGDLHQPLHAGDDDDRGGNQVLVLDGRKTVAERLHAYWDKTVVERLGRDPERIADVLIKRYESQADAIAQGNPKSWAQESFEVARDVAYALPGETESDAHGDTAYRLDGAYEQAAVPAASQQMARGGIRLARMLNEAFR
jgi:hypothetical protein